MRKYSFQHKFQYFLFFIATAVQLFLIFKYDPGNIISKFIASPTLTQIIWFVFLVIPFMAIPILIISMTVVHVVDNIIFLKANKQRDKRMEKRGFSKKFLKEIAKDHGISEPIFKKKKKSRSMADQTKSKR